MNLTYLNVTLTGKVQRWKLYLQDKDFYLCHVPGTEVHQFVPDALSRLCENHMLSNENETPAHKRHMAFLASIEPKHRISDTLLRYTIPSRLLQVEHSFATAYSKEKIGLVERANQEVVRHLRAMLFDDKWSYEQLPMVQRIMNTVEKTSTGVSPAELILDNSIRLSNMILALGSANPTSNNLLLTNRLYIVNIHIRNSS